MPTKAKRTNPEAANSLKFDNPKEIIEALKATRGMQTLAADRLGVSRKTLYAYRQRWPEIDEEIETWRQRRVDTAEIALDKAVMSGESWAVTFILNCLGRDRGYGNQSKVELTGAEGQPLLEPLAAALDKAYGQRDESKADEPGA